MQVFTPKPQTPSNPKVAGHSTLACANESSADPGFFPETRQGI